MQRGNHMNGAKRNLDGNDDDQPEPKRPALACMIVEALKVDSLQKLCSSLEPIFRRVVSEEVDRALAKIPPSRFTSYGPSPKRLSGPNGRNLQLHFKSRLSLPLFTGGRVVGEQDSAIHVVLIDAHTKRPVTYGPEASLKLEVVVLEGDFNNEDDEDWSHEEFETHVVKEREGKRPLLTGDLFAVLKEGVGTLGHLVFTDNSSWIRSRKFRLGLRVASGECDGIRVREAKTEAFTVRDHRGELYKKHYPPGLSDEVWRLEKIGKDGPFHKKLTAAGIVNVEEFLRNFVRDPAKLRAILGSGMSNKMWDVLVEHAKTCVLSGKLYIYFTEDSRSVGVVFNNIYELRGLISGDQYLPADSLSDSQKVYVDGLVKKAYENWNHVTEYEGKSLLNFNHPERLTLNQSSLLSEFSIRGSNQMVDQCMGIHQDNIGSSVDQTNVNPLEDEDMQQLLQIFSNGEDGFGFSSFMQNTPMMHGFEEDRVRSGKAVVGWLKIKAAMRWGIFIRRKAAERRAQQIVELDDDQVAC